jgi:hypothetical protein
MSYTNENRTDGFGAQYQGIITTILFCMKNKLNYQYTPISYAEHNYNGDHNYLNKLEELMNLKPNIQNNTNTESDSSTTMLLFRDITRFFEENIDEYCNSESMKFIKECFWKNKERDHFKNNKTNVAVHIRRENTHDMGLAGQRAAVPNTYYLHVMNAIREKYKNRDLLFHIYSQGKIEKFKDLESDNVVFHLNEEIGSTFIGMVAADMLIISPSSFSYVAGFLSDGIVYYKNFWHNPKKEWIVCQ